jgi:hypothetical protein
MADWVTISSLATAGGTLVLAGATFASVRSANRAARVAERSLLAGLQPLLVTSRLDDATQKVNFADAKVLVTPGGGGAAEVTDEAVYLTLSLRNAGSGIAVLHGWHFYPERNADLQRPDEADFRPLTRDLYVAPGDIGFWQGAFRDPSEPGFAAARSAVEAREVVSVDILYGDYEGGQRTITRFALWPMDDDRWLAGVGRHWNVDRDDPREH